MIRFLFFKKVEEKQKNLYFILKKAPKWMLWILNIVLCNFQSETSNSEV